MASSTLCGEVAYAGLFENVAVDNDPLSYIADTQVFEAESNDISLIDAPNPKKYQVVSYLANYASSSTASTFTSEGDITFVDPCTLATFPDTTQTSLGDYAYLGEDLVFTLTPFTIYPAGLCTATYSCTGISFNGSPATGISCSDLTANGQLFVPGSATEGGTLTLNLDSTAYQTGSYLPGTYMVTIQGTIDGQSITAEGTYTFTLVDPCDPPVSVEAPTLATTEYTITEVGKELAAPGFTVTPSYCPLTLSFDIAEINGLTGKSAITQKVGDSNTLVWSYDSDLDPVGRT